MSHDSEENKNKGKEQAMHDDEDPESSVQWVIGGISTLLVALLIGFIFYEAVSGTDLPPILSVRHERALPVDQGYVVEFTVINTGGLTAKNVTIEGVLKDQNKVIEKSNVTITFVPSHSERQGGLIFTHDPRKYKLDIQPKGYDRP